MTKPTDVMIDIETLGMTPNAVVTQIGALAFNRYTGNTDEGLLINVKIQDSLDRGMEVDEVALKFWWDHTPTFLTESVKVPAAANTFAQYMHQYRGLPVWAHATFDFPLLANLCQKGGMNGLPFSFRNCRDIRTLVDLVGWEKPKGHEGDDPKNHNALDDCRFQVGYCVEALRRLNDVTTTAD